MSSTPMGTPITPLAPATPPGQTISWDDRTLLAMMAATLHHELRGDVQEAVRRAVALLKAVDDYLTSPQAAVIGPGPIFMPPGVASTTPIGPAPQPPPAALAPVASETLHSGPPEPMRNRRHHERGKPSL